MKPICYCVNRYYYFTPLLVYAVYYPYILIDLLSLWVLSFYLQLFALACPLSDLPVCRTDFLDDKSNILSSLTFWIRLYSVGKFYCCFYLLLVDFTAEEWLSFLLFKLQKELCSSHIWVCPRILHSYFASLQCSRFNLALHQLSEFEITRCPLSTSDFCKSSKPMKALCVMCLFWSQVSHLSLKHYKQFGGWKLSAFLN